jgi:hypothetical protein
MRSRRPAFALPPAQVSKRVRSAEYVQKMLQDGSNAKRHALRYASIEVEEEVYLHPRSALHRCARREAPPPAAPAEPAAPAAPAPRPPALRAGTWQARSWSSRPRPLPQPDPPAATRELIPPAPSSPPPLSPPTRHRQAPEFVVYTQLVRTAKRPYMAGLTAVEPAWLAQGGSQLVKVSEPLEVRTPPLPRPTTIRRPGTAGAPASLAPLLRTPLPAPASSGGLRLWRLPAAQHDHRAADIAAQRLCAPHSPGLGVAWPWPGLAP